MYCTAVRSSLSEDEMFQYIFQDKSVQSVRSVFLCVIQCIREQVQLLSAQELHFPRIEPRPCEQIIVGRKKRKSNEEAASDGCHKRQQTTFNVLKRAWVCAAYKWKINHKPKRNSRQPTLQFKCSEKPTKSFRQLRP